MRVGMVVPRYSPTIAGGGEISCKLLVDALAKYVDIEVISFDGNTTQQKEVDGIKVKRIRAFSKSKIFTNIQAYHILKKIVKKYDILHTYNMELLPAIGKLTKKYYINSVATLNGIVFSPSMSVYKISKYLSPKFYRNKFLIHYIRHIKHFTTLCPFYRDKWIRDGINKNKITVIPNMIDNKFSVSHNKEDDVIRILFVGNYAKWRNLDTLLEAYSNMPKQNIELVVVGKGWEDTINKWLPKVKNRMRYINNILYNKISEVYGICDIFIQPYSFPVPISRTLIEALQSGLVVITTGNDYYSPIIRNGIDGVLLYPMTAEALANKLQELIDDENMRKRLAENGRKRVYEVCSPDRIVKQYMGVYEEVMK